jgi:hypothetical protein
MSQEFVGIVIDRPKGAQFVEVIHLGDALPPGQFFEGKRPPEGKTVRNRWCFE